MLCGGSSAVHKLQCKGCRRDVEAPFCRRPLWDPGGTIRQERARGEGCVCFALLLTLTPTCSVTPGVSVCTHLCLPSTCSLPAEMQATAGMYRENVVSRCVFITSHLPQVPLGATEQTHQQTQLNGPSGLKFRDKWFFCLLLGMGQPPGSICPSVWVWDGPPLGPRGTTGCVGTKLPDGLRAEAWGSL